MRQWVTGQLPTGSSDPLVIIDPHNLITDQEIQFAVGSSAIFKVLDWFTLRKAWELHGRHWRANDLRLVLVVRDAKINSNIDLPYDIEQSSIVHRLSIPGPSEVRSALLSLDDDASDLAVERLRTETLTPTDAILTAASGLPAIPVVGLPAREVQVALRFLNQPQPEDVAGLARGFLNDPLASAILDAPPRLHELERVWQEWISSPESSSWSAYIRECKAELIELFLSGRLRPAHRDEEPIPEWALIGVADESAVDRAESLLSSPPSAKDSLEGWIRTARWWGQLRSVLAQVNPPDADLESRAWQWWSEMDVQFLEWLRSGYGLQLSRTWSSWPISVDKIQPFLAKRRAIAPKVLLVVLDGMSFTQWFYIRESAQLEASQTGGVLAMLPTLTEVSRQAIAAGAFPTDFEDSLGSTHMEPKRWGAAWSASQVAARWIRIDGVRVEELDNVPFGEADAIGLVISATDKLLHDSELLGDHGLHAQLQAWVKTGVLTTLLERASEHGYETWLTADHGNLAVETTKAPREGDFVEQNGTRARRYASKTLRDAAAVNGIIWDELPGFPPARAEKLLFAPGRTGWGQSRLSHGGLSLDEVIVPLVMIER
jgi:hypothetical protein